MHVVKPADFRLKVKKDGGWVELGSQDEWTQIGGMYAVSLGGAKPFLAPESDTKRVLVLPDGSTTEDWSYATGVMDKLGELRKALGQAVGRLGNSPKDEEIEAWRRVLAALKAVEKGFFSPIQEKMHGSLIHSLEKGLEIHAARLKLQMPWHHCYPNANPREATPRAPRGSKVNDAASRRRGRPPKTQE
jgi:hypothetical protein